MNLAAANEYTALHEGERPHGVVQEHVAPFVGPKHVLGRLTDVQYTKPVTDGSYPYHHPFAEHAQPTLFVDATGRPGLYRGRYKTTYRGIEDRTRNEIEDERLPGRATRLITLGKVEFLRYKWEDEDGEIRTEEIRFRPHEAWVLSHDQRGDLHFTGGRLLKEHTEMKHSRSGKSRSRRNPSGGSDKSMMGRGKRILVTGLAVGLGAAATMIGVNMLFQRFTWSAPVKALAKMGTGVVGAMLAGMALPSVPALAAGIAVGGVSAGLMDLYTAYIVPRIGARTAAAAGLPALSAGHVPAGFGVNRGAACGIG